MEGQAHSAANGGRKTRVKNKAPAPVQITVEQILRESHDMQVQEAPAPKQMIMDKNELDEYKLEKRKTFEDFIRYNRYKMANYVRYAKFEEKLGEFERARSIYERALEVDYREVRIWLRYAEMEMKNRFVQHARNIWDRAVTLLPRMDQLWFKYAFMEEMLGNVPGARRVFERWMQWHPNEKAWMTYINMEVRYKEFDRARNIYERFVESHNTPAAWLKFAKFCEKSRSSGRTEQTRSVFERAMESLGEEALTPAFLIEFASFEEREREFDRARVIYKYALDNLPKNDAEEVHRAYMSFEKKHGDREGIEDAVLAKRRFQYEEELKQNPRNYDVWFDYVRLEEEDGEHSRIREVYERAISNVPLSSEKRHWRRYIYLWIMYAVFEELDADDVDRAREVYKACVGIVPHKNFTFAKIWLLFASFEIRQKNLKAARLLLGRAIGMCPKDRLFRGYIELELQLGEIDRVRKIYEKYIECFPANCAAWTKFAELEVSLGEDDRARAIYELAVSQPQLDMPELLWKNYVDFEIACGAYDRTRSLYERLLEKTQHVKVWLSFARFEDEEAGDHERARATFERAYKAFSQDAATKEERLMVLEAWRDAEVNAGDADMAAEVNKKMPRKVKKRRAVTGDDGSVQGFEEIVDYIFPDDASTKPNLKLLEMAHRWKQQQGGMSADAAE